MNKQVNINQNLQYASRAYNMWMGNILKCQSYFNLVNTVKSMLECPAFLPGELEKLKRLSLIVESGIQRKNLGGQTEACHVKLENQN